MVTKPMYFIGRVYFCNHTWLNQKSSWNFNASFTKWKNVYACIICAFQH